MDETQNDNTPTEAVESVVELQPVEAVAEVQNSEPVADVAPVEPAPVEPPPVEQAQDPQLAPTPALATLERDMHTVLTDIEDLAIFWGGEIGTKLRNLVGEARSKL